MSTHYNPEDYEVGQDAVRALHAIRIKIVEYQRATHDAVAVHHARTAPIMDAFKSLLIDACNYHALTISASQDAERAIQACKVAEEALAESKRPFTAQMEMQNRRIIALQAEVDELRKRA